jgi:hypothetical protein
VNPADSARIHAHVQAINACNQRGGRMLSLVDLIDAGTVNPPLAAYLAAAMRAGVSLLVGARPGGAGKTAIMCALLNWLPDRTTLRAADRPAVLADAQRDRPGEVCYLAHEIGAGRYTAYVWGQAARAFFALAAGGHTVVSNLHADTLDETHDQLCRENGVPRAHVDAVTLKVYLRVEHRAGSVHRRVSHVYESDGTADRLLWTGDGRGAFARRAESALVTADQQAVQARFLDRLRRQDIRRIEDVRRALICPA